ncbi:MAG: hypothetical protein JXQ23_14040, partial [Clostridia bacterium]|nr:hypothetical protein [Clostridia bacterium]
YDCDELCLRCDQAYHYMKTSILTCYRHFGFDGLYIDFAWPGQAICTDSSHHHEQELFNFYDYFRMIRELRKTIGHDAIMIGHGGSIMVSSDFVEGFDGCLTGEGQKDMAPETIGVQNGNAPTLWTFHRRKQDTFRSASSMAGIIREGITPHVGLGILGKSIIATLDPAHTPPYIALWQMWRAFPVHEATYYNYLTEKVVTLNNDEVTYSLYVTKSKQMLLIICNGGGSYAEKMFSVGVNIQLDMEKLALPDTMSCYKMSGNTYETFRIAQQEPCHNGMIHVEEIGIHEFIGFILSEDEPPEEMVQLEMYLENRFERLAGIYSSKMKRLKECDQLLKQFEKSKSNNQPMEADKLMTRRVAE